VRLLVAWDDPNEAELIHMYLSLGGENEVALCATRESLLRLADAEPWDVVFMAETFPGTSDDGFACFMDLRSVVPEVPVVLGARPTEMFGLPRFLKHGLRSYVIRDARGDFLFLLLASLESTVAAVRAERASILAERLREELEGVRRLQETIIPRGIRSQTGYRTVARYEPSEVNIAGGQPVVMAGGDYYEVFPVDDHTLVMLVGDASGHGLKACMSIITMHTLIHMISNEAYRDTSGFVDIINKRLCENLIVQSGGGFITLFYAAIDTQRHVMEWASAGHPPALLHDRRDGEVVPVGSSADGGLPLGITTEFGYEAHYTKLPLNSRLLIYSDGLTDALAPGGRQYAMFGVGGISRTLERCRAKPLEETLDALFRESRAFTGGEGRHDDTSVVLVERHEP
jgi:phosphoserine phosphatase RsbU/P